MIASETVLANMARGGYDITSIQKPKPEPKPAEPQPVEHEITEKPSGN
jgi:hypothetical protein